MKLVLSGLGGFFYSKELFDKEVISGLYDIRSRGIIPFNNPVLNIESCPAYSSLSFNFNVDVLIDQKFFFRGKTTDFNVILLKKNDLKYDYITAMKLSKMVMSVELNSFDKNKLYIFSQEFPFLSNHNLYGVIYMEDEIKEKIILKCRELEISLNKDKMFQELYLKEPGFLESFFLEFKDEKGKVEKEISFLFKNNKLVIDNDFKLNDEIENI